MKFGWNIRLLGKENSEKQKPVKGQSTGKTESRRRLITALIVMGIVCILGISAELLCYFSSSGALFPIAGAEGQEREIPLTEVTCEGFKRTDNGLLFNGQQGILRIPLNGRHVDKFRYSYSYEGLLNLTAKAGVYNEYGELRERDILTIEDRNSKVLKNSYLKIGENAEYVELTVSRDGLFEPGLSYLDYGSYTLTFTGFGTKISPFINPYRLFFFWCAFGIAALFFRGRKWIEEKAAAVFLIIALSVGTLLSLSLPANKVSWDEEIHFAQAFWLSNYRTPVPVSPTIYQEFSAGVDTWPYNQPGTIEEQAEFHRYLDATGDYRNGEMLWSTDLNKTIFTGYAGSAVFLKIGQLLSMPFSMLFRFGRLGNLFVYCIVMYLAIRKTPVGKGIMAFIGLMPETIMLAGVYSYDPTVTAFLYLAFAYILWAVLEQKEKIGWKEYTVILLAFFWGGRIKAIYAPLLLMGLLIPQEHFQSKRQMRLMKAGFVLLFAVLMASFILPVLIAPSSTGDVRGEATSEVGQMAYVLGHPIAYGMILIKNIFRTLPSYVLGENALGLMGHQGAVPFPWLIYVASTIVILADGSTSLKERLNNRQKIWIFALCAVTVVFVWTSMYIVFTTPGNTYIDGVQGRYYVPFLFLVWLVLSSCVPSDKGDKTRYSLALGLGGVILLASYYTNVLSKFCL